MQVTLNYEWKYPKVGAASTLPMRPQLFLVRSQQSGHLLHNSLFPIYNKTIQVSSASYAPYLLNHKECCPPWGIWGQQVEKLPVYWRHSYLFSLDSRAQVTAHFLHFTLEFKDKTPSCCRDSFPSLNEIHIFFLTCKNEEFYLYLSDNDLNIIITTCTCWFRHHYEIGTMGAYNCFHFL